MGAGTSRDERSAVENIADYTDHAAAAWTTLVPDAHRSTLEITMRLRRLVHELDRITADVINSTSLTAYGDYQVLSTLRRTATPLQPSALATMLQVTRSGMTGRLHRLEQLGLVTRLRHPRDARGALIEITPEGERVADGIFLAAQEAQRAALDALDPDEQRALSELLRSALLALDDRATETHRPEAHEEGADH